MVFFIHRAYYGVRNLSYCCCFISATLCWQRFCYLQLALTIDAAACCCCCICLHAVFVSLYLLYGLPLPSGSRPKTMWSCLGACWLGMGMAGFTSWRLRYYLRHIFGDLLSLMTAGATRRSTYIQIQCVCGGGVLFIWRGTWPSRGGLPSTVAP